MEADARNVDTVVLISSMITEYLVARADQTRLRTSNSCVGSAIAKKEIVFNEGGDAWTSWKALKFLANRLKEMFTRS